MDIPWRTALLVVAAAFFVFLVAKMLPRRAPGVTGGAGLSDAKARVRAAKTEREKAAALCDAAAAALALPFGATRAIAYFLRAMRADPTWGGSVERAFEALSHRRAHALEKMLWRRLAATPWDATHAEAVRALVTSLAAISKKLRGHTGQAGTMERLLAGESLKLA